MPAVPYVLHLLSCHQPGSIRFDDAIRHKIRVVTTLGYTTKSYIRYDIINLVLTFCEPYTSMFSSGET
jgi:hypothetical protein